MARLYKPFVIIRTVLCAVLGCFFIAAAPAWAQSELFTVQGVNVDVTAENALAARDQAFVQAQEQAFKTLMERMLPDDAAPALAPDPSVISSLIQDYEVTREKLSAVRYIGTYTFRFRDSAVRQYFKLRGVEYTDVSSKPLLVLPFLQKGDRALLWSPYNAWIQAWSRSESGGGLVPVLVPIGDLDDVKDIADNEVTSYDSRRLAAMVARYGAGEAVIVLAVPDENLALIAGDSEPATGALTLNIYRTDNGESPEFVQQLVETARPGQTKGALFDAAVKTVRAALRQDWKARTMVAPAQSASRLLVRVSFSNLQEWTETRRALGRVYGIDEVNLKGLTPKAAQVELVFHGTEERLRLALQQADMTLSAPRYTGSGYLDAAPGMPQIYDLYLNKYGAYQGRF